ncbi:HAD-IG family 5'-nucleotidase, partial [bacterium]|nr:HAD-IG family 5'-nucleotidase [bacterium]
MIQRYEYVKRAAKESELESWQRVYTNRNLKLENVSHMGFDMDHTLAVYHEKLEELAFDLSIKNLVENLGYDKKILEFKYRYGGVIRGLVVDKVRGNVIKLDTYKYVEIAYHGEHRMSRDERKILYAKPGESYRPDGDEYRYLDTLFCLPEAYLFMKMVTFMDAREGEREDYTDLAGDIRKSIDSIHRDGSLKKEISMNLNSYVNKNTMLAKTLHHFIQGGKKLFLLTNSEYYFTDLILTHLLGDELGEYTAWQDYFEIVVVSSKKPGFFLKDTEMKSIRKDEFGVKIPEAVAFKVFRGGYFSKIEELIGAKGENIMYFGDHTFGDILKSKQTCGWRTAMIIEELEKELKVIDSHKDKNGSLSRMRGELYDLQEELHIYEDKIHILRDRKIDSFDDLTKTELEKMDKKIAESQNILSQLEGQLSETVWKIKSLEEELMEDYNPDWGCLFKSSRRKSRLGDQVEDFACVYTSSITNFYYYP